MTGTSKPWEETRVHCWRQCRQIKVVLSQLHDQCFPMEKWSQNFQEKMPTVIRTKPNFLRKRINFWRRSCKFFLHIFRPKLGIQLPEQFKGENSFFIEIILATFECSCRVHLSHDKQKARDFNCADKCFQLKHDWTPETTSWNLT